MTRTTTYHELFRILNDIETTSAQHASFAILNSTRINYFMKQNGPRIQAMTKNNADLIMLYVKKDEKGNPCLVTDESGQSSLAFETDEDKENYTKAFWDFMNRHIDLYL